MKITIPGRPVPKGRPRVGRGGRVYTPKKTREWESMARDAASLQCREPLEGAVKMSLSVFVKDRRHGDYDNYWKACADALNGIAYHDDKQVLRVGEGGIFFDADERVEIHLEGVV